jgi:hypothetical protein
MFAKYFYLRKEKRKKVRNTKIIEKYFKIKEKPINQI